MEAARGSGGLGGGGGVAPPPPPSPRNIFLQTSQSWASVEVHFLFLSDTSAKLMTICILKHLKNHYSQVTWNELTSLKCFSPQFIHRILAGFILTYSIFSGDYFLN